MTTQTRFIRENESRTTQFTEPREAWNLKNGGWAKTKSLRQAPTKTKQSQECQNTDAEKNRLKQSHACSSAQEIVKKLLRQTVRKTHRLGL